MKIVDKQFPVVIAEGREQIIILAYHQDVEGHNDGQQHQRQAALFASDAEYIFYCFHAYFFKKKRTNTKLTGTQMQNMGMGANVLLTPNHKNSCSVDICNR